MTTSMPITREREGIRTQPLYERVLGDDWHRLDPVIRRAHLHGEGITGVGSARISTGSSPAARFFCRLLRLPRAGEFDASVDVIEKDDTEVWIRRFGQHVVKTSQKRIGIGLILEKFKWVQFAIAVERCSEGVTYRSRTAQIRLGFVTIPLPKRIQPRIIALESATLTGNGVDVSVFFPGDRLLISYVGEFDWSEE
jgi:hypothetical protein